MDVGSFTKSCQIRRRYYCITGVTLAGVDVGCVLMGPGKVALAARVYQRHACGRSKLAIRPVVCGDGERQLPATNRRSHASSAVRSGVGSAL